MVGTALYDEGAYACGGKKRPNDHISPAIVLAGFIVLVIVYLAVDGAGTQVASPDPKQQLAQAAAGSPENPANTGTACTAENDRACNANCSAQTAEDPQHRKWVCDRAITDQEGSVCRYACILAEQNACGPRQRVEFFSPTRGRCWGCAGDETVPDSQCEREAPRYGTVPTPQFDEQGYPIDDALPDLGEILERELSGEPQEFYRDLRVPQSTFEPVQPVQMGTFDTGLPTDGVGQSGGTPPAPSGSAQPSASALPAPRPPTTQTGGQQLGTARSAAPAAVAPTQIDAGVPSGLGSITDWQAPNPDLRSPTPTGYRSLRPYTPFGTNAVDTQAASGIGDALRRFLGTPAIVYETPQGQAHDAPAVRQTHAYERIAYAPENGGVVVPRPTSQLRSIRQIASDVTDETQTAELPRGDHFAHELLVVGGPSAAAAIDTENASFGRIQDLIVEDEAIRALFVAEQTAKRAKDRVFCLTGETGASCHDRRKTIAETVERATFAAELERRNLPEPALQHFLAVYDGWLRPSPAPATRATSTLGALHASEQDRLATYETQASEGGFVWWIIENVGDAIGNAVDAVARFVSGAEE